MDEPGFFIVGRIRKPHGIRGELVVESLTDTPDAFLAAGGRVFVGTVSGDVGPDPENVLITGARPFREGFLLTLDCVSDRDQAELWRGRYLFVGEDEIEQPGEGEAFVHELVDMSVVHADGSTLGPVVQVYELPQGLILEMKRADGNLVMIPFREEIVQSVDRKLRRITITPPEGLIDL